MVMKLWTEYVYQVLGGDDTRSLSPGLSILTTEDQFATAVVSGCPAALSAGLTSRVTARLKLGGLVDAIVDETLAALPAGEHAAIALLRVERDGRASLAEIDAPPLFMARRGDFVLLPVVEEERSGHLVRRCDFTVQPGDHLAIVSESYIRAQGGVRPWSWWHVAVSIRRLTATGCDAEQLAGALVRTYERLAQGDRGAWSVERGATRDKSEGRSEIRDPKRRAELVEGSPIPVTVLAMLVRPMRTATVWSGPPAGPPSLAREKEQAMLERLMAEEGTRIICGDTTAEIAARLLGASLELEPHPADGWKEVPPTSRMIGPDGAEPIALVTEGAVTMRVAGERLAAAKHSRELAGREDAASRLARLLLTADKVRFLVGLAVNPAQKTADGRPLRKVAVERLVEDLQARGKIVSVQYF
jgi:hypothetical protein